MGRSSFLKEKLEVKILGAGFLILIVGILVTTFAVIHWQRKDVFGIAEEKLNLAADLIVGNLEKTMETGNPEFSKLLLPEFGKLKAIEEVSVFNALGKEAFKPESPAREAQVLSELSRTREPLLKREESRFVLYRPLLNKPGCSVCHPGAPILGAVKITASLEREYARISKFVVLMGGGSFLGAVLLGIFFWLILGRFVIKPVQEIEREARKMADGDLAIKMGVKTKDEIGRLKRSIEESLYSVGGILNRVKEISGRVAHTINRVEKDSARAIEFTRKETEAVSEISNSLEEMDASMTEVAESTDGLASSVEQTAVAIEQIVASIESISATANDLSSGVETTSSSIEELSATLKEVAGGAKELATVSDETISAIEEIISSIKEVEEKAQTSARLSERVSNEASTLGVTSIERTKQGMDRIKQSVQRTAGVLHKLGGRSEEIGNILTVIDDITEQTTLLALNAAILASQAGEKGKGFSVVADEIKSLAERTGLSTQEIASLIQSVQQEVKAAQDNMKEGIKSVEEGMKLADDAGQFLKKILGSSKESSEAALSIERSTAEQARSARYISDSVEKVRVMVGKMARATSEQSKGISLIIQASEKMKDASLHVKTATGQQAESSRQISQAVEVISDRSRQISNALNEQKTGASQIFHSVEKIKDIPKESRDISMGINRAIRELLKDAELMDAEMGRFRLPEPGDNGNSVLRFGIVPLESPAGMYAKFSPLASYLSKKLEKRVQLRVSANFESAVKEIGEGGVDFCYMTPSTYIQARNKYGVQVLAKALRQGKPFHHSVIVAREGGSIKSIHDIRGKSFAFGDENSTSSHIMPRAMLFEAGIELKDLAYYNYLGHHDDVARAVLIGEFEAGGIMESTAQRYRGQGLVFIKVSPEIPEFNIAHKGLQGETAGNLKKALLELADSNPEILKAIDPAWTGFAESTDQDYDGIRLTMTKLGID